MIKKLSPDSVFLPVPHYVAATHVSPASEWVVTSGQVGITPDGAIVEGLEQQTTVALENVFRILRDSGMTMENIVKLNFFVKEGENVEHLRNARNKLMPNTPVASTIIFISGLVMDELLVEIDCTAAS